MGLAIFFRRDKSPSSRVLLAAVIVGLLVSLGLLWKPVVSSERVAGRFAACQHRLRELAAALQRYHEVNGCFPPAYITDENGKPMHSWRVLILPYLDYDSLYKQYDFKEPWNGPKNKQFSESAQGICLPFR